MKLRIASILASLLLSACASDIPLNIRQAPVNNPGIRLVAADLNHFQGQNVRWGGTISAVENRETDTWVEVVGRELGFYGQPYANDESPGRFLVRIEGYLDPDIYKPNRELTVYGMVESTITRKIDEFPYTYPLVKAAEYYLWPESTYQYTGYPGYDPYYYDPYPIRYYPRSVYDPRTGRRYYYRYR